MELQLGLGLPDNRIMGFDLNSNYGSYEIKDSFAVDLIKKSKRTFDEAFDDTKNVEVPQTLPLFNSTLSDQDDNISDIELNSSVTKNKNERVVVGWPPVKSWRRKLCQQKQGGYCGGGDGGSKSMFVKVKMEGVGIARKVDLSLYDSYQALAHTLIDMFGKCIVATTGLEDMETYKLTYQDKEGDWLLAGDVPWGTFIETVQRLKLLKNAEDYQVASC